MKPAILAIILAATSVASAQTTVTIGRNEVSPRRTYLSAVAGDAAAASLTFVLDLGQSSSTNLASKSYAMANLYVNFDGTGNGTAVTMTCNASDDGGTTLYAIQSCDVSAGVCTSSDASWSRTTSVSDTWLWRVDVRGLSYASCVVAVTSGSATDAVTIRGTLSTL